MAAKEHNFRYILKPGNDFQFVSKFRAWIIGSLLLCSASIAMLFVNKQVRGDYMNWTIDFKGGTEIVYAFQQKPTTPPDPAVTVKPAPTYVRPDIGKVRDALNKAGVEGFDVSEMSWVQQLPGGKETTAKGILLRTPRFGAITEKQQQEVAEAFKTKFADREIDAVRWTGDRLFVRAKQPIKEEEAAEVFKQFSLDPVPWGESAATYLTPDKSTGEYELTFSIQGLARQYEQVLEQALPDVDVVPEQSSTVSAKAGSELRDDGIKSIFYAMLLIMLYLAVRFDIRYAPGAIIATLHDAIMVIGVFAVTWTEVSLTSVAALLTVVGFSVNDTVVIFDRIRENMDKLKDKRIDRIIDISLNEVLVRSILTSVTLFAVTLMMNVFGTGLVRNFAFAMNVGIIVGAYSSLFLAPPVFVWITKKWYSGAPSPRSRASAAAASEP